MRISTRAITLTATLTALCFVSGLLPYVFFLPVTVAAATLTAGTVAAVGLAFGVVSIIYSFVMPASLVAVAFMQAPYIALLPRAAAALGAYAVFRLMTRALGDGSRGRKWAAASVSAAAGSILNTALVVSMFALVLPELELGGLTMWAYIPTMLVSGAIECAAMAALTPPVALAVRRFVPSCVSRTERLRKRESAATDTDACGKTGASA